MAPVRRGIPTAPSPVTVAVASQPSGRPRLHNDLSWTLHLAPGGPPAPGGRTRGYRRSASPLGARLRDDSRVILQPAESGIIETNANQREVGPLQAVEIPLNVATDGWRMVVLGLAAGDGVRLG
jgi:hypothetical protein